MEENHVPHVYPEGRNEDRSRTSAFLHQRSIKVHRPVLFVDDRWWHLDLGPLCNEISQRLGVDGRPRGLQNALTHQLECPLHNSSRGIPVLDDLTEREGHHDCHWMRLEVVTQLPFVDEDGV